MLKKSGTTNLLEFLGDSNQRGRRGTAHKCIFLDFAKSIDDVDTKKQPAGKTLWAWRQREGAEFIQGLIDI